MSVISCDYLPSNQPEAVPAELALLIIRKAASLAADFEERALDQMTRDARRALSQGATIQCIERLMGLKHFTLGQTMTRNFPNTTIP